MNFLSHFYLDRHSEDPYYVLGIALPDLWSGFSSLYNSKLRYQLDQHDDHEASQALISGIERHYKVDKAFHYSPIFDEHVALIKKLLSRQDMISFNRRIYFFAHILFEMMLDRHVLLNETNIADKFYELIDATIPEQIEYYADLQGITDGLNAFYYNFDHFKNSRFLYQYSNIGGLIYGLNRIHMKINRSDIHEEDQQKLYMALHELDEIMKHNWQNTFKIVKEQIS